jgi:hypothetical protein
MKKRVSKTVKTEEQQEARKKMIAKAIEYLRKT